MSNSCIIDFEDLLKKSYGKLKVHDINNLSTTNFIIAITNNFAEYFPEIKILKSPVILSKTVAYYLQEKCIVMTKDTIYDFIIITYNFFYSLITTIENFKLSSRSAIGDNNLFDICNDVLYSYDSFDESIKIQIPNLIVDLISILFFKSDPYGNRMSTFQIKSFYTSKKELLIKKSYSYPLKVISCKNISYLRDIENNDNKEGQKKIIHDTVKKGSNLSSDIIKSDKQIITDNFLFKLNEITKRDVNSIKHSLSKLDEKEIKKLYDICNNYNKVIEYGKITNIKDLKIEIERELNRTLSDKQIRHSQISIKKVQFYIESLLDRKFEIHLTHGINHVKHNFEYGYRLAGLLKNSKIKGNML